MNTLFS
jgi:tubulin alpha